MRLGEQGRDVFVDLWCVPAQETLWSILSSRFTASETPPALLSTVPLEIPVPVQDPSGGTQCIITAAAAAVLGRINSLVLSLLVRCKCYLVKIFFFFFFFHFHPTENNPPGSWKQPLCFLLATSSLFSHVHFSNQCGDACQERLLLNFSLTASWHIFLKGNQIYQKPHEDLTKK